MGYAANGELLKAAEEAGFDLLLTTDNNLTYQQNLNDRKLAIVVLNGNRWRLVQRVIRKIVTAVGLCNGCDRQKLLSSV